MVQVVELVLVEDTQGIYLTHQGRDKMDIPKGSIYKPLSESMMIIFLTHICVTQPQWVKWNFNQNMDIFFHS